MRDRDTFLLQELAKIEGNDLDIIADELKGGEIKESFSNYFRRRYE